MDEVAGGPVLDEGFARELVDRVRAEGVLLVGPRGLLGGLTKQVLETALEAEMTDHLGDEANAPIDRNRALPEAGQLEIATSQVAECSDAVGR